MATWHSTLKGGRLAIEVRPFFALPAEVAGAASAEAARVAALLGAEA